MRVLIGLLISSSVWANQGNVVGQERYNGPQGPLVVTLYDAPCASKPEVHSVLRGVPPDAKLLMYVGPRKDRTVGEVPGCWVEREGRIFMGFIDGDFASRPKEALMGKEA